MIHQYTVQLEDEEVVGPMRRSSPAPNLDVVSLRKRFRLGPIFLIFQVGPTR